MKKLKEVIETFTDFPKKGIEFKDILGIMQDPELFSDVITKMSSSRIIKNADAIISIDARGFIFGSAISLVAAKPMIVARKPGKLPGKLVERDYALEYGQNKLSIQSKSLFRFNSFAIVDDILATGGTVDCVSNLIQDNKRVVTGLVVLVELKDLKGGNKFSFPVDSQLEL